MEQKTEIGTFNDSPTNFVLQKVYTSNRNSSVKLTFPAIGARNAAAGKVNNRGISRMCGPVPPVMQATPTLMVEMQLLFILKIQEINSLYSYINTG